mmetsp:Transcript_86315/g.279487  ORF Transcript_86315/g.279487 Transcript_86315/m.279487 type:complete len:576 (-) Transcript_86315:239-1966(-)
MRRMRGLAVASLLLGPCCATWHPLQRAKQQVRAFDRSVLGNLRGAGEVANLQVSRSHVFVASITVGTPPQALTCLLDSGSADLWVPSRRCKSCRNTHHFHAEESSTFMPAIAHTPRGDVPVPVQASGNTGAVVGFLVQDTVGLGSATLRNQSFLIVEEARLPRHRAWDGVCGLGWREMSTAGEPLYRNMQKLGGRAVFALVPTSASQTYLVVGEVPSAGYEAETLVWVDAERLGPGGHRSFWVAAGGLGTHTSKPMKTRFLLDTGTRFVLAPRKLYTHFVRSLFPSSLFDRLCGVDAAAGSLVVCDCSITQSDGVLTEHLRIYLGGRVFALEVPELFERVPTADGGELCLLQIQPNALAPADPLELLAELLGAGVPARPGAPPPFLLPGGAPLAAGEQVEEVSETRRDGKLCTTTLVWAHGGLQRNTTHCTPRSGTARRLRAPGSGAAVQEQMDDLWVLGGVFLEHFMAVLDFEQMQIGFAKAARSPATASPGARPPPSAESRPQAAEAPERGGGAFPWAVALLGGGLAAAAACASMLSRKLRRRKCLSAPLDTGLEASQDARAAEADVDTAAAE